MKIHVQRIGESAVLPRQELEQLVQLARRSEQVALQAQPADVSTRDWMRLAEGGGAFDFWHEPGEDIYTLDDGEPL